MRYFHWIITPHWTWTLSLETLKRDQSLHRLRDLSTFYFLLTFFKCNLKPFSHSLLVFILMKDYWGTAMSVCVCVCLCSSQESCFLSVSTAFQSLLVASIVLVLGQLQFEEPLFVCDDTVLWLVMIYILSGSHPIVFPECCTSQLPWRVVVISRFNHLWQNSSNLSTTQDYLTTGRKS